GQGKWLTMSAARGNRGAQYKYAMAGVATMVPAGAGVLPDPEEVKNYHQLAAGYMQDLAEQCNIDAISAIASMGLEADGHFGSAPDLAHKFAAGKMQLSKKPDANDPLRAKAQAKLPASVNAAILK